MAKDLSNVFDALDLAIRNSHLQSSQKELLKIKRLKLNDEEIVRFASLCCRAGLPGLGASKLRLIVRVRGRKKTEALPKHVIEYAGCLVLLGASREAENLLQLLSPDEYPEIHKIQAHIHIREWNYHMAIPHLEAHIKAIPSGDYASTVSKLNLSMSFIFEERFNNAAQILNEIITGEENFKFPILKGNCFRLLGGLEVYRRNYEVGIQCFQKAYMTFGEPEGLDSFLVRKWIALAQYFMQNGSPIAKIMLDSVLQEAVIRKHWETVRDMEYQLACFHKDEKQLIKLYFGTSYPRLKSRLKNRFPDLVIPSSYAWELGKGSRDNIRSFDLGESSLKPGQAVHRLMSILTSDFYRSFNTLDLFQRVYPGEFYSFGHSEQKIHQLATRLRAQFSREKLPFVIDSTGNLFRLAATLPINIFLKEKTRSLHTQNDHRLALLKAQFGEKPFTLHDVMASFSLAHTTANQFIRESVENGFLVRIGKGMKTQYKFSDSFLPAEKKAA